MEKISTTPSSAESSTTSELPGMAASASSRRVLASIQRILFSEAAVIVGHAVNLGELARASKVKIATF